MDYYAAPREDRIIFYGPCHSYRQIHRQQQKSTFLYLFLCDPPLTGGRIKSCTLSVRLSVHPSVLCPNRKTISGLLFTMSYIFQHRECVIFAIFIGFKKSFFCVKSSKTERHLSVLLITPDLLLHDCQNWAHENKSESSRFLSFLSFCTILTTFNMLFLMALSSFNENAYILQN